ncbi:hypothetical protein V2J09_015173 [Rumex salicifolius]
MWRNSLSFYSTTRKLLSSQPSPFTNSHPSIINLLRNPDPLLSHLYSSTAPRPPPSVDSVKLGLGLAGSLDATSSISRDFTGSLSHYGRCYWELSKARLSMLVVATSGAGYILGSGQAINFPGLCLTCAGTMMVAASANSLNQVFEVENDAKMKRTMLRPLPSGRITVPHAVTWATVAGASGTALLASQANMLAAGLAASNLVLYAFVYTPLKQIHPVNTWVGAIVGAIPPLLGWAAASGQISLNAMILPAALYFWQIPHFMALAYMCRNDYAAGGYKMISLFDPSGKKTALIALRNCLYLIPLGYLAYEWGLTSGWFCLESSLFNLAIGATALSFYYDRTTKNARRMFFASLLYLPVFMAGLVFHRLSDNWQSNTENNTFKVANTSSLFIDEGEEIHSPKPGKDLRKRTPRSRPPVAYASVAPFPFLPAPTYEITRQYTLGNPASNAAASQNLPPWAAGTASESLMPMQRVCCHISHTSQETILSPSSSLAPHSHFTIQFSGPPSCLSSGFQSSPIPLTQISEPDSSTPKISSSLANPSKLTISRPFLHKMLAVKNHPGSQTSRFCLWETQKNMLVQPYDITINIKARIHHRRVWDYTLGALRFNNFQI